MVNDAQSVGADPRCVIEYFVPGNASLGNAELSIVVPALNEEITVGEFVEWCKEGLKRAGVVGQVLIIDSSNDDTAKIVVRIPNECSYWRISLVAVQPSITGISRSMSTMV